MAYCCSVCGKTHDDWPAWGFLSPLPYSQLSDQEKQDIANLSDDFCLITYPDQTDRFIRCSMFLKVADHDQDLNYGVWVSVSQKSYEDYEENFMNEDHVTQYFGRLCNNLPDYENTMGIPVTIDTQKGDLRPEIVPHEDHKHPFVRDFYTGISLHEAERRIHKMLDNLSS